LAETGLIEPSTDREPFNAPWAGVILGGGQEGKSYSAVIRFAHPGL